MQYYASEANSASVFMDHFSNHRKIHACACMFYVTFMRTELTATPLHKLTSGRNLHMGLEQDRKCTNNETWRCVLEISVAMDEH
jgi:hypothetical protein